jgi:hypothetical protein
VDVFAHGLWAYAATKAVNKKLKEKKKRPLNALFTTFWGIFPDLFAFALPFLWIAASLMLGNFHFSDFSYTRLHGTEPPTQNSFWIWTLPHSLYDVSHSVITFLLVFGILYLVLKRPVWELGGWLFHLLIDIPSHPYQFYPTPILWPISGWKFTDGVSWATPWFMILNYSALAVVYLFIFIRSRRHNKTKPQRLTNL